MFARDIDSALDYERISSPNLKALNRTRSSDSLIAASDISELDSWSETGSYFVVDPLSSARESISEASSEVKTEWAAGEECTRQLREAMSWSVYCPEQSRLNHPEDSCQEAAAYSADRNPFGCQGLNPRIPYITPPKDGFDDNDSEAAYGEDLRIRGEGHDSLDLDQNVADSIIDAADVFTTDPCHHQEHKGFKLPFFSRKKSPTPKSVKPSSSRGFGVRMPSVPSVSKLLGKRANPAEESRNNPAWESKTEQVCQRSLCGRETCEMFFDQQVEQKKDFVRLSNASTATLTLESVDDMQRLNDALPTFRLGSHA